MITQKITVDPVYRKVQDATAKLQSILIKEMNSDKVAAALYEYEDTVNSLYGSILSLSDADKVPLLKGMLEVIGLASTRGYTINLYSDDASVSEIKVKTESSVRTGKKLYPQTISYNLAGQTITVPLETSAPINTTTSEIVIAPDVVDPVFAQQDAELDALANVPYAMDQTVDPLPVILPAEINEAALRAAANTNGLQAGLVELSQNPLADIINTTRNTILYYTENNYANLNVALTEASSNVSLTTEYRALLDAIGGLDGLSGIVSQLDNFEDHTNRLSGLTLPNDSEFAEPDDESTTEDLYYNDVSGDLYPIISFSAKKFRSAKYWIQATAGDSGHQATELYVTHDNRVVYTRQVESVYTEDPFIELTAQLLDGNIRVLANTAYPNTKFVTYGIRLRIARNSESYKRMSQSKILNNAQQLTSFLNDGVNYTAYQCGSLTKRGLVGNIGREFRDMLSRLSNAIFEAQSVAAKQAAILDWAASINNDTSALQESINSDYTAFMDCGRKLEALGIAYTLTTGYQDSNTKSVIAPTLNTQVKTILDEAEK